MFRFESFAPDYLEPLPENAKKPLFAMPPALVLLLAVTLSGCELLGDLLKLGFWAGVIVVVLIVALLMMVRRFFRRRL